MLAALLRTVSGQGPQQVRRIAEAAAAEIAGRHGDIAALAHPQERITAALAALLEDVRGAEIRRVGRDYVVTLRDCPLLALAEEFPVVCDITRALLRRLVRAEVEQQEWLVRGDACCSFRLRPERPGRHRRVAAEPRRQARVQRKDSHP